MEIIFENLSGDDSVMEYEKDYLAILERTIQLLHKSEELECSVIFVTPEKIHEINREYRHVDRPTDVISFAMLDDTSNIFIEEEQYELGDIFINIQAARDQAAQYGHSQRREFCFLFTHGLLHLLGYDHMEKEDEEVMFALQDEILDPLAAR